MNKKLIREVAMRVNEEEGDFLLECLAKNPSEDKADDLYALCYILLEELEGEEE
jgi:hypothetical protein